MIYKRWFNLPKILEKKSILLLGPRQTGKSTLVRKLFPDAVYTDLSEADSYRELSARPELLRQRLRAEDEMIIIDEAQRLPELFDEVQVILDRSAKIRAVLTGSSARKLRRTGVNLLPGRIWKQDLFPLVYPELGELRLQERFERGSLPGIIDSADYKDELRNYVGLYLNEEVRSEGLVRGIGSFSRFLVVAALCNAEQLNFSNISRDTGISVNTVRAYFEILEDTLIGYQLQPFRKTKTRKAVAAPKFYLFDCGVVNALLGRFEIAGEMLGKALEHLIFLELRAYLAYQNSDQQLTYWRSLSKIEVDFLIGKRVAIEVKNKERVSEHDEKGLHALGEDLPLERKIIVCHERAARRSESGVEILPVEMFLVQLWEGRIAHS